MFSSAVFFEHRNTCDKIINETSCFDYVDSSLIFMPFSLLALVINTFSLFIFLRQKHSSVMRTSLILLSLSELGFHFWSNVYYINIASGLCNYKTQPERVWQVVLGGLAAEFSDMFLITRNWCNVLITMSRIEVVLCPMKTIRFFKRKTIRSLYLFVLAVTISMVLLRMTYERLVICANPFTWLQLEMRFSPEVNTLLLDYFDVYVYFMIQTIIPVVSVLIMSIIIAYQISPWKEASITANDARRRRQMRATKAVLCLAVIFTILEMPTFVLLFIDRMDIQLDKNLASKSAEMLVILDSIMNIIVYMSGMPEFRKQLTNCGRSRNQTTRSLPVSCSRSGFGRCNRDVNDITPTTEMAILRRPMLAN